MRISCLLLMVSLLLTGCVTTSDSALTRRADPDKAVERYVQLGLEYIKRNDLVRARKHLTRALEIDEENASAHGALGLIYHEDGENDLAEASFINALKYDSKYTQGRTYYGAFLYASQRYAEALEQFIIASKDMSYQSRDQIFTNIALCSIKLGDESAAIAAYDKTLKLDRFNGRALSGITELYIEQQNFVKAQYYYNRLVRLIKQQGLKHSASSLWMGIRIARHFGSQDQLGNLVNLLKTLYPESAEYSKYQSLEQRGGA